MTIKADAESAVESKQVFKLGYFLFTLKHCKAEFSAELSNVLPHASAEEAMYPEVYELNMSCTEDPRGLFNDVLRRHYKCLWVDAACLISPSGKKVLVCGPTGAGKSTLAAALALGFNWTVVSEDVTLTDPESNQVLNFAAPFFLNENSVELIKQTIGVVPQEMFLKHWAPLHGCSNKQAHHAPFDVAIYIDNIGSGEKLETTNLPVSEILPKLLPISNLARKQGVDKFLSYLPESKCFVFRGGQLHERLRSVVELCGESPDLNSNESAVALRGSGSKPDKPFQKTYRYLRSEHIVCAVQGDGNSILVGKRDDSALMIGPAASLVWEFCDGKHTASEIMDELHRLGVPVEFGQTQIIELIEQLSEEGLVSQV